jgi:hypothetical protein
MSKEEREEESQCHPSIYESKIIQAGSMRIRAKHCRKEETVILLVERRMGRRHAKT